MTLSKKTVVKPIQESQISIYDVFFVNRIRNIHMVESWSEQTAFPGTAVIRSSHVLLNLFFFKKKGNERTLIKFNLHNKIVKLNCFLGTHLKLVSAVFNFSWKKYLWKIPFISSKKIFSFSRYSDFYISRSFPK